MPDVLTAPAADEFDQFYAGYIGHVSDRDARAVIHEQLQALPALLITVADAGFRYAPDKWTIKEVIGHLCDTERVLAYRMMRIVRDDPTPIPGFDENQYVPAGNFNARELGDLVMEWEACRHATLALVESIEFAKWTSRGTANGQTVSARALAYIVAGHTQHHLEILRTRYGVGSDQP